MSTITVCMKSGKCHNVESPFKSITEAIDNMTPSNTIDKQWTICKLTKIDFNGNDTIIINGNDISAIKYVSAK